MRKNTATCLCLFFTLLFTLCIIAGESYEFKSESGALPPNIMPVVIPQDSNYEMDYQYGQQAGQYLIVRKESSWAQALQNLNRERRNGATLVWWQAAFSSPFLSSLFYKQVKIKKAHLCRSFRIRRDQIIN